MKIISLLLILLFVSILPAQAGIKHLVSEGKCRAYLIAKQWKYRAEDAIDEAITDSKRLINWGLFPLRLTIWVVADAVEIVDFEAGMKIYALEDFVILDP